MATEPYGATGFVSLLVTTVRDQDPPSVSVDVRPGALCPDYPVTVCLTADDPFGVAQSELTRDGVQSQTAEGGAVCLTTTFPSPGTHHYVGTATDASGNAAQASGMVEIEDCVAQQFPILRFASPEDGVRITSSTDVFLSEMTPTLGNSITAWRAILYADGTDPSQGRAVASGLDPADALSGALFTFDPTVHPSHTTSLPPDLPRSATRPPVTRGP